jgi:hypothetical protein
MEAALAGLVAGARIAFGTVVTASVHGAVGWILLGLALHLANQVARGHGWWAVVNAAAGGEPVRRRDAVGAWIAGAGVAGVVTARLGDLLRVLLLARVAPHLGRSRLAGTLVAEAAGELAVGTGVTAAAVLLGVGVSVGFGLGGIALAAGLAIAAVATLAGRARARRRKAKPGDGTRRGRLSRVLVAARDGCAALCAPRDYARHVLPWQLASRGLRFAALACFLVAFGLPVTVQSVLLVVLAQSAGNAIPFSPAAAAAGAATLAATLGPLTHTAVPTGHVVAFYVSTIGLLSAMGVLCAATITAVVTISARRARARAVTAPGTPATAPSPS